MTTFVIQCEKVKGNLMPMFDFCFEAIQAINYQNWFHGNVYDFVLAEEIRDEHKECIPIGSVEFVTNHMKKFHNISDINPLNIPDILFPFAKREIMRVSRDNLWPVIYSHDRLFVKADDQIKGYADICTPKSNIPFSNRYLVSEVIGINTEWRCFVRNGKLLDMKCYSGEFNIFPDVAEINKMISAYTEAPPAYTIDVGVNTKGETVIIECHNFFSCGLYGFSDYRYLLDMFLKAYHWQINHSK